MGKRKKEMMINTVAGKECRIAVMENGTLEELYVERESSASHVGNVYKGRIMNVESSIQAAFVDFGTEKNGFLHISDIHPKYFPGKKGGSESVGNRRSHRNRPPIQACLRRGQEVVVQVTKEGIGTKGPTLTTYLSIPGRLLVMMPGMERLGVSRKIEDEEARNKARKILNELKTPDDMGFIVRTAGLGRSKRDFNRDLNYLVRLWKSVKKQIQQAKAPAEIYRESDLVTRTIRDVYNTDVDRVVCDSEAVARRVREFLDVAMPRTKHTIELYTGSEGLFHATGLEKEIERIYSRRVEMPGGGSLVIDQTEALVAIDVNSGRYRKHSNAETTALKINEQAAREIIRQLRLRDLGGVIVIDFIDMREDKNCRAVEKIVRDELKRDRAKTRVLKMSSFGIVEMTRQRVRPSLKHSIYRTCAHCEGSGLIKSEESQSLLVMRSLQRVVHNDDVVRVEVAVTPSVATHVNNHQRIELADLEKRIGKNIVVRGDADLPGDGMKITCWNSRGNEMSWEPPEESRESDNIPTVNIENIRRSKQDDQGKPAEDKPGPSDESGDKGKGEEDKSEKGKSDKGKSDKGKSDKGGDTSSGKKKPSRRRRRRKKKSDSGDSDRKDSDDGGTDRDKDKGDDGGSGSKSGSGKGSGADDGSDGKPDSGKGSKGGDGGSGGKSGSDKDGGDKSGEGKDSGDSGKDSGKSKSRGRRRSRRSRRKSDKSDGSNKDGKSEDGSSGGKKDGGSDDAKKNGGSGGDKGGDGD